MSGKFVNILNNNNHNAKASFKINNNSIRAINYKIKKNYKYIFWKF